MIATILCLNSYFAALKLGGVGSWLQSTVCWEFGLFGYFSILSTFMPLSGWMKHEGLFQDS